MNKPLTECDVAIIGGGPGGSTTGTLIKKYEPDLHVVILERERFPRDHVGESQLPPIGAILQEMGCWDKVEAADFPIKIGATYRWGSSPEMWDFDFVPADEFQVQPRPAAYTGQRIQTALQVDRSRYDEILLQHAAELGCEVRMETGVINIVREQDRVSQLDLSDGNVVKAHWYVDASGHAGTLRRAMDVPVECPTHLKNIAIWDYWENASWADKIGVGGTRVQLMSIPHGWIWFIPLGPTRTSIGLVCPADYFKTCGLTTKQLYDQSVHQEARIAKLIEGGSQRGKVESTSDWSFLAERTVGENWFLVGESAGFADPILAAGMTLTHTGAREAAYSLLALMKKQRPHDPDWIKSQYDRNQRARIGQHIRFADFWYASNGQFTDLQEHCREIAKTAGLELNSQQAFAWLSQGGFTNDVIGQTGIGGLSLSATKQLTEQFTEGSLDWSINKYNRFRLNLSGATVEQIPKYTAGRIESIICYCRGGKRLVKTDMFELMIRLIDQHAAVEDIVRRLLPFLKQRYSAAHANVAFSLAVQALEVMISEGWVEASLDPNGARLSVSIPQAGGMIHPHRNATPRS